MKIITDDGFLGVASNHPLAEKNNLLVYNDQTFSVFPKDFFITWTGESPDFGVFEIGKCSGLGFGSKVKYDNPLQKLRIGRFVSGGSNVKFILNGQHTIETPSSYMFNLIDMKTKDVQILPDIILENDIWICDETMILGGAHVSSGCVIGARSLVTQKQKLEPFGIYAGNPARLIRFRFDPQIIEALLELEWWSKPIEWIKQNNNFFLTDLNQDVNKSLDIIAQTKASYPAFLKRLEEKLLDDMIQERSEHISHPMSRSSSQAI